MPNFELPNDAVVSIPIQTTNISGTVESPPAGDTFTASSSSPSLNTVIGLMADGVTPALIMNATVQLSPGLVATVADSAGLAQATLTVDIVADVTPKNIVLDAAGFTSVPQLVPTAPGP